jgi:hypothetical protein
MSEKARFWVAFLLLFSLAAVLAAINLHAPWREAIRERFLPEKREILAQARGELFPPDKNHPELRRNFAVLKVLTREALVIEVFELDSVTGNSQFRAKVTLPEKRDGYFNYHGSATNLLLIDENNDGILEIVAPGFDENLIPRVHVYRLNDEANSLDLLDLQSLQN